jgi:hypothetical protein
VRCQIVLERASTFLPIKNPATGMIPMVKSDAGERTDPAWNAS